jgi:hypothetical protein
VGLAATFAALGLRDIIVSSKSFETTVVSIVAVSAIIVVVASYIMRTFDTGGLLVPVGQLAAVAAVMVAAVGIGTSSAPWQMRESIETPNEVITGWVIGGDARWLRVLTDTKPRRVRVLRVADVEARRVPP